MEQVDWLIPLATAIIGIVVGTFLRPVVEEWHKRRLQTVTFVEAQYSGTFVPPNPAMTISIGESSFSSVISRNFWIENRTNRSLRDFTLDLIPSGKNQQGTFAIFLEGGGEAQLEVENVSTGASMKFSWFPPKAKIAGTLISDTEMTISARADRDLEVEKVRPRKENIDVWYARMMFLLVLAMIGFAILEWVK